MPSGPHPRLFEERSKALQKCCKCAHKPKGRTFKPLTPTSKSSRKVKWQIRNNGGWEAAHRLTADGRFLLPPEQQPKVCGCACHAAAAAQKKRVRGPDKTKRKPRSLGIRDGVKDVETQTHVTSEKGRD